MEENKFGTDVLKEAGLRAIRFFDTLEDSLEDKKIQMDEWWQIGTAGVATTYILKNGAELKKQALDLSVEEKDECIAYWKANAQVGIDDEELYAYVLDCLAFLYDSYIEGKALVERGKALFGGK